MTDDTCSICLNRFSDEWDVVITPCNHLFDSGCLRRWLASSSTCPQCRSRCTPYNVQPTLFLSKSRTWERLSQPAPMSDYVYTTMFSAVSVSEVPAFPLIVQPVLCCYNAVMDLIRK